MVSDADIDATLTRDDSNGYIWSNGMDLKCSGGHNFSQI